MASCQLCLWSADSGTGIRGIRCSDSSSSFMVGVGDDRSGGLSSISDDAANLINKMFQTMILWI
jgi:hypothetical protein